MTRLSLVPPLTSLPAQLDQLYLATSSAGALNCIFRASNTVCNYWTQSYNIYGYLINVRLHETEATSLLPGIAH